MASYPCCNETTLFEAPLHGVWCIIMYSGGAAPRDVNGHTVIFLQTPACRQRYVRSEVCVLADSLFQFLQETQVCSRTRTNTFFILPKKKRSLNPQHHPPPIPSLKAFAHGGRRHWTKTPSSHTSSGERSRAEWLIRHLRSASQTMESGRLETP